MIYRNQGKIETGSRISKCNYGSHHYYSIETAILEKRLIYDTSQLMGKVTIHNLTNLQSYYNRQLPNFASVIEKLVGIECAPIKLFTKFFPVFRHFVSTGYGISSNFYGGQNNPVRGTR